MKIVKDPPSHKATDGISKIEIICKEYTPAREIFCHKTLTRERWFDFSFVEQMANIGAEIGRTINWRNKDNRQSSRHFESGLELLDLTIDDEKNKDKFEELCRVREALADYFCFNNIYGSSDAKWNNYFYSFNYAARLEKV